MDWSDYVFCFQQAKQPKKVRKSSIDQFSRLYMEEHKGERGIVFFPTLEAAKAYQRRTGLEGWVLTRAIGVAALIAASVEWWRCNAAFSVHLEDAGFRRDVTAITQDDSKPFRQDFVDDGNHKHKGTRMN